jgi:hypothetical protein
MRLSNALQGSNRLGFLSNRDFGRKSGVFVPKMAFDREMRRKTALDFCQVAISAEKAGFLR